MRHWRSLILDTGLRTVFHTVLLFSLYLLFAGHNAPGGGFIGGLVAAAGFVLVYVSGGSEEVGRAAPIAPPALLGAGLLLAGLVGAAAWLWDGAFLESAALELELPFLGMIKAYSVLVFDAGVYLVVVGLTLGVLRSLGAEVER